MALDGEQLKTLRAVLEACQLFLEKKSSAKPDQVAAVEATLQATLHKLVATEIPGTPQSRRTIILALENLIRFLVALAWGDRRRTLDRTPEVDEETKPRDARIKDIGRLTDLIANLVKKRLAISDSCRSELFTTMARLKQAYWSKKKDLNGPLPRHPAYNVLRINDVPFAESVFVELLSHLASEAGYVVEVQNVAWSDVGMALHTGRINVALYNGSIIHQFPGIAHRFGRKLIYASNKLYKYQHYPILRAVEKTPRALNHIGVPFNSDFDDVIKTNRDGKRLSLRTPRGLRWVRVDDITYCDSADEALDSVVSGKLKYCIVGALQSDYAARQFPAMVEEIGQVDRLPPAKDPKRKRMFQKIRDEDQGIVRFWAAVDRRDEAERIIGTMLAIWNNHVLRLWEKIGHGMKINVEKDEDRLLDFINAQPYRVFVDRFGSLKLLIDKHDGPLNPADYGVIRLEDQ